MKKVACLTGLNGQLGPYLSKMLYDKGYTVVGIVRRTSQDIFDFDNIIDHKLITIVEADLLDQNSLYRIIQEFRPTEFYNLAAQSHVGTSFNEPIHTVDVTALGVLRLLEVLRLHFPEIKFFQASSSEMFGNINNPELPKNEDTKFNPMSPYAASKILAHNLVNIYRKSYNLFACSAIMFNCESPRRSHRFVTRKITDWMARLNCGLLNPNDSLKLGYIDARRDFGSAIDFVDGIYKIMNHKNPDDYVLSTGIDHSVREIIELCLHKLNRNIEWVGSKDQEVGIITGDGSYSIKIDTTLYRPSEVPLLKGDYNKIYQELGWCPKMNFSELIDWMISEDIKKYDYSKH